MIDTTQDIIDSRDIIARIEELQQFDESDLDGDDKKELADLEAVAEQGEGYGDWEHGEALIHADYFTEYTRQLLEDCGYIPADLPGWITIDWEDTADNVKADYMTIEFDGATYYMRA